MGVFTVVGQAMTNRSADVRSSKGADCLAWHRTGLAMIAVRAKSLLSQ